MAITKAGTTLIAVRIDNDLLAKLKARKRTRGTSIQFQVNEALRALLGEPEEVVRDTEAPGAGFYRRKT